MAMCRNTPGSYRCVCQSGFKFDDSGLTCTGMHSRIHCHDIGKTVALSNNTLISYHLLFIRTLYGMILCDHRYKGAKHPRASGFIPTIHVSTNIALTHKNIIKCTRKLFDSQDSFAIKDMGTRFSSIFLSRGGK